MKKKVENIHPDLYTYLKVIVLFYINIATNNLTYELVSLMKVTGTQVLYPPVLLLVEVHSGSVSGPSQTPWLTQGFARMYTLTVNKSCPTPSSAFT